jgi:dipeptidyl aminopeptidase/acylaminoacyl peptidase
MDTDLERSIAIVLARHPRSIRRDGAVLTGYSRGGYAVPFIAGMHPGRWPFLLIIEADATLDPASLRRARVRAVALVAGELGDQIAEMRKTANALVAASFPARLFVMPRTGHLYSGNMEDVMREALAFLLACEGDAGDP